MQQYIPAGMRDVLWVRHMSLFKPVLYHSVMYWNLISLPGSVYHLIFSFWSTAIFSQFNNKHHHFQASTYKPVIKVKSQKWTERFAMMGHIIIQSIKVMFTKFSQIWCCKKTFQTAVGCLCLCHSRCLKSWDSGSVFFEIFIGHHSICFFNKPSGMHHNTALKGLNRYADWPKGGALQFQVKISKINEWSAMWRT